MKILMEYPVTFINNVDFEFIVPENTEILLPIIINDELKLRVLKAQPETSFIKRKFRMYKLQDIIDDSIIKAYIGSVTFNNEEQHIFEMNI